jgi:hypothetical protein
LDDIVALTATWLDREWNWREMPAEGAPVNGAALPKMLESLPPRGWDRFASELSTRTVAYDVSAPVLGKPGITNAVLFEINTWRRMPTITAAPRIVAPTGGWQFAAWQTTGRLYVLAWKGPAPARRIRSLLNSQQPAAIA